MKSLAERMSIKPGYIGAIINAPENYTPELPESVTLVEGEAGNLDFIHLFVRNKAELDANAPRAMNALKEDGLLWISYPKRSSKVETDITRDNGWDVMTQAGLRGVAQVSVDETWSALRFRAKED